MLHAGSKVTLQVLADEPVHCAAIDVGDGVVLAVRAAAIDVVEVVVGAGAATADVRHAHGRHPVPHGDAVSSRIGSEVAVERPVLLHDDDHMLDFVNSGPGVMDDV